jgi:hypothetical protein
MEFIAEFINVARKKIAVRIEIKWQTYRNRQKSLSSLYLIANGLKRNRC